MSRSAGLTADLFRACGIVVNIGATIRRGKYINETRNVAESTLTNIMIRMSAYTGKEVAWDESMKSEIELKKPDYELTPENIKAHIPIPGCDVPKTATKES